VLSAGVPWDSRAERMRFSYGSRAESCGPVTCPVFPHITPPFQSRGLHGWVGGGFPFFSHSMLSILA
jgi:hypothetical protein